MGHVCKRLSLKRRLWKILDLFRGRKRVAVIYYPIIRANICVNTFHLIKHTLSPYEVGLCFLDVKGLLGRQKAYAGDVPRMVGSMGAGVPGVGAVRVQRGAQPRLVCGVGRWVKEHFLEETQESQVLKDGSDFAW